MGRRSVDDELRSDVILDIPKQHEHRFGCSGKMLKPSRATWRLWSRRSRKAWS
jgi:hypothetical protein